MRKTEERETKQRKTEERGAKKQEAERREVKGKAVKKRHFWGIGRRRVHRQTKDRLFRFLFEKDREALLQLYNTLNGTDYEDASLLQVVTIESAVYIVMKNDLAFVLAGTLNLYEHQSTYNPNMPLRFLIYLAQEYQKLVEQAQESLYGTKRIMLPTPQCVVFYNGEKEIPEEEVLRLSDCFENEKRNARADVELTVRMLNINHGHNGELMEKCRVLREYAAFVELSRQYLALGMEPKAALEAAIADCIRQDILAEFLRTYRAEVLGMLLEEFDVKKYERSLREEGREEGIEQGIEQESARYSELICILLEQHREHDLRRAAEDPEYRKYLYEEFHVL
ncbi:MAG: Rpn family recombination-promoting nuclease/putative transposase [bacterium]|nr:Rpn family recombination-promoting nuclease/putative transposase [bacterium]